MIVLLPHCGFLSETSRMLTIFRALEARGVPAMIASHGGPYAHLLDEARVSWTRLEPSMDEAQSRDFLEGVLSLGPKPKPLYTDAFMRAAVRGEVDLFQRVGARMAVIGFNLTSYVSTRVAKIPLATSHGGSFVPPVLERGLCPIAVNPPVPQLSKLPKFVRRWMANNMPRLLKAPVRDLNRLAAELGVQGVPNLLAMMCGDLTLVTDLPELLGISPEEMEAWRPGKHLWPTTRMRYVGPLFATLNRPIPERVERLLSAPGPVVFVSPTSVRTEFLRGLVPAVAAAGARVLVGSTIHQVKELENESVLVEGVLPNHLVMPRVAAAVIMGGQGSVQTAMASGTPFIGMPYHGEQELNVATAERQGAAVRLSPAVASTSEMTTAVRRLLEEPRFRENAARVKRLFEKVDGAQAAATAILEYLEERGHRASSGKTVAALAG